MTKQAWHIVTEREGRSRKGARRVRVHNVKAHSIHKALRKVRKAGKHWHVVSVMPGAVIKGRHSSKHV